MKVYQLLYISQPVQPLDRHGLASLLTECRRNNEANKITGLLLYNKNAFMQCIEGPAFKVHQLFNAIEADKRHTDVQEIYCKPIMKRHFTDWRMGFRYFKPQCNREDVFASVISILSSSIDKNMSLPNMRGFMKEFYEVPRHDVFEGWLHSYAV